jgi:hypothetical protein
MIFPATQSASPAYLMSPLRFGHAGGHLHSLSHPSHAVSDTLAPIKVSKNEKPSYPKQAVSFLGEFYKNLLHPLPQEKHATDLGRLTALKFWFQDFGRILMEDLKRLWGFFLGHNQPSHSHAHHHDGHSHTHAHDGHSHAVSPKTVHTHSDDHDHANCSHHHH